jgi:hypothetical protein
MASVKSERTASCRWAKTQGLRVDPQVLLWFNQLANGGVDETAEHGSCPVAEEGDTKLTATLHVWNGEIYDHWLRQKMRRLSRVI